MENQRLTESEFKGKLKELYIATCDFFYEQAMPDELTFIVICVLKRVMEKEGFKDDYAAAIDKFGTLAQEHLASFKN